MPQKTLPPEILEKIFSELPIENVCTCQSVCRSWHIPAKRDFYKHVEFKSSFCVNFFLTCITPKNDLHLSTIPSPGTFVKRIFFSHAPTTSIMQNFSIGSTLSAKHIQVLARQCPNVTIVDCTQNLNTLIVIGLLSLGDDISWKYLASFPDNKLTKELYRQCSYKFRHSLTTLYFDMGSQGFSYLREFPSLTILDLSNALISDIEELEYVLNVCKHLTQLVLNIKQQQQESKKSVSRHLSRFSLYSSLKLLKLRTDDDKFDCVFFEYFMYKFNQLVSLEICGVDILDTSLNDKADYLRLIRWINTLKSSELVLTGRDYNMNPQVVTEYLSGIFKTQLDTVKYNTTLNVHNTNHEMTNSNNTTLLVFSSISIRPSYVHRDIDIQLPDFETDNRLIHKNYINQFCAYVNEIFISYEGTPIYTQGCNYFLGSIIEQCSMLRSVNVNFCDLSLTTDVINEAITEFSISNSQISLDFFETLSFCCPNLKSLTLHRNFHSRNEEYSIYISMPHSNLEVLSLLEEVHLPWISIQRGDGNSNSNWTIKVSTTLDGRDRFFMLDTSTSVVTELSEYNQRSVLHRISNNNSIYIGVQCRALKKFRISTSFAHTTIDL